MLSFSAQFCFFFSVLCLLWLVWHVWHPCTVFCLTANSITCTLRVHFKITFFRMRQKVTKPAMTTRTSRLIQTTTAAVHPTKRKIKRKRNKIGPNQTEAHLKIQTITIIKTKQRLQSVKIAIPHQKWVHLQHLQHLQQVEQPTHQLETFYLFYILFYTLIFFVCIQRVFFFSICRITPIRI